MINYIIKSNSWLGKIARRTQKPESWVEFSEKDFCFKQKRGIFPPFQKKMKWNQVSTISACMIDCFTCHSRAIMFVDFDDNAITVHDDVVGWVEYFDIIKGRFKGFNAHNFDVASSCFPWTASLPCWDCNKTIDNLEVYGGEDFIEIVWEKDKSVFLREESKEGLPIEKLKHLIPWKRSKKDGVMTESRKEMLEILNKFLKENAIIDDIVSQSLKYSNDYLLDNIAIAFQSPLTEHKAVSSWLEVAKMSISAIEEGWGPDYYNVKLKN